MPGGMGGLVMAQNECPWQLLGGNRGSDTLTKAWLRANECKYVNKI